MTNLISVIGRVGSGKTLYLVMMAKRLNRTIYSNFKLNLPNYKPLKLIDIIDLESHVNVFIDEAYAWIDSRTSGKAVNKYCSYVVLQSRKTFTDISVTAQYFSTVDLRFRLASNIIVECKAIGKQIYENAIVPKKFHYTIRNRETNKRSYKEISYIDAIPYFKLYDTYEIVDSADKEALEYHFIRNDSKLLKRKVISIANFIQADIKKLTHDSLKYTMLVNEIPLEYETYVYTYLKGYLKS